MCPERDPSKIPRDELNRRRILKSAKELFIENGVENVNMHQIAKTAGVGQASLYRRYSDKGDICLEIAYEEYQSLFDEVQGFLDKNSEMGPLDRLYQIIVRYVSFLEAKVPWLCDISRASTGHRPMQSPLCQWMRKESSILLNEAVEREEVSDIDVSYTIEALLVLLHNVDYHLLDEGFTTKRVVDGLQRIFIEGLKAQKR
ncbi:transcriptional regulator [Gordoniibacillus kamchatkensis]|uniref:Transcriptional regulator n=1 Tax=Gordoniibacillus kamchatkensis TaxID=1590651 RepID=A0ABR5A4Y4_9BACL|nr:TetR/AcrR family transcriptional regulator [Paenibacillus sp. VKM B-2647]KIL36092.1 transcriptional regulator [Paenibacillus sp. VKM B-2647]